MLRYFAALRADLLQDEDDVMAGRLQGSLAIFPTDFRTQAKPFFYTSASISHVRVRFAAFAWRKLAATLGAHALTTRLASPPLCSNKEQEQQFSIQPHPAKDNDPSSLDGAKGLLGGDKANPTSAAPGPHIMSNETAKRCPSAPTQTQAYCI